MTFWLEKEWQTRAALAVKTALDGVHLSLKEQGVDHDVWTASTLRSFVPVARELCGVGAVCALKRPPDDRCKGEWLYDFCCWIEGTETDEGFLGLPIAVESEWGGWNDVWDDLDKLTQARAGLRVFVFDARWAPKDWHEVMSRRIRKFDPASADDAWVFAGWTSGGFEFQSNLV